MNNRPGRGAVCKLLGYSAVGIFVFFVRVPCGEGGSIPADLLISLLKRALSAGYQWLLLALSAGFVLFRVRSREGRFREGRGIVSLLPGVAALAALLTGVCGVGPAPWLTAVDSAVNATGNILCAILISSLFMPFLLDYGLVDAMGVLCRPVMRRLFRTPGSSAVIGVSAFLGNYSMGHVVSAKMYEEGDFTERESVIVATGFSTCSIGLMLNLAGYLGLMEHWQLYVLCVLACTFGTTAVVCRLFPISRKKDGGHEEDIARERAGTGNPLLRAWRAGLARAQESPGVLRAQGVILRRVAPVILEVAVTSVCVITGASLLVSYTPLFTWLGQIFTPLLRLCGIAPAELNTVATGLGVSLMEPVLAGVVSQGMELSDAARWVLAVTPYSAIVFFAGFVPSVRSSGIHVKTWELLLIWLERVVLSLLLMLVLLRL